MTLSLSTEATDVAIAPRGPLSAELLDVLADRRPERAENLPQLARDAVLVEDPITDDDVQLSLFLLYSVAYGSLPQFGAHWEWDVSLLATRAVLERAFEDAVRAAVPLPEAPQPTREDVAAALFALAAPQPGPSLSHFVSRKADVDQARELLMQRSIYTLREADAHSWAIPRLTGRAKAALIEIQADEYGGGRVERMHQVMFADAMRGAGLDDTYGAYVDVVPAITFASFNLMTMFALNRRLQGAVVGHLAAFEMTSSLPSRAIAEGLRRLGFGDDVAAYYDEHVEADAVHEQIAARDLAGSQAEDAPELLDDILFGAAACLTVDGWASEHILHAWEAGRSSLRDERQSA